MVLYLTDKIYLNPSNDFKLNRPNAKKHTSGPEIFDGETL
jgi:hypothetical protein